MLTKTITTIAPLTLLALSISACSGNKAQNTSSVTAKSGQQNIASQTVPKTRVKPYTVRTAIFKPRNNLNRYRNNSFSSKLSNAALSRLKSRVRYDGSYVKIRYPMGDVPSNIGVCTDVVIRSYRKLGIDLQEQVHNDMSQAFNAYPNVKKWGLSQPDTNIDHRRVYNLQAFFKRRGAALPVTRNPENYKPGDLVTWMVGPGLPHIGVVVDRKSKADPRRNLIVHNIANGPEMEDVLFRFPITGHYRYTPANMQNLPRSGMYVSNGQKRQNNNAAYSQLMADAARIMKLGKKSPTSVAINSSTENGVSPTAGQMNIAANDTNTNSSMNNIKLAQAKMGGYSTAQLSNLLK